MECPLSPRHGLSSSYRWDRPSGTEVNKWSHTVDKGLLCSLEIGHGANNFSLQKYQPKGKRCLGKHPK
jgi:hypothetical protein